MTQKTLQKKVDQLKQLQAQKKAVESQISVLQVEIKAEMMNRGTDETAVGDWVVRFKTVVSNKFNSKQFATDHPRLYKKYLAQSESMRFTVVESA